MNEGKLRVRDVEFNGAELRAAQDEAGKIWVGVRWVCQGMGFGEDKIDNERKKMQKDIVISQGVKFHSLGSSNANPDVLCIDLEYLPLWLAKIAITPTMKKENPDLVQKLITYQLKAKDVLAAAFLNKPMETKPEVKGNVLQVQLPDMNVPDYSTELKSMEDKMQRLIDDNILLNNKVDQMYTEMGKFAALMLQNKASMIASTEVKNNKKSKSSKIDDCRKWKNEQYAVIDKILLSGRFNDRVAVLNHIYKMMNNVYGTVWEQEIKEYKSKYNLSGRVPYIDIIYDSNMLKSIFSETLKDLYNKYKNFCVDRMTSIIQPLKDKRGDKTVTGMQTYRVVYKRMKEMYPTINWDSVTKRYESKYGKYHTKKDLIEKNEELLRKFQNAVEFLLIQ